MAFCHVRPIWAKVVKMRTNFGSKSLNSRNFTKNTRIKLNPRKGLVSNAFVHACGENRSQMPQLPRCCRISNTGLAEPLMDENTA